MIVSQQIIDFINQHHVLNLATSKLNFPYCCNVFYVYDSKKNQLVFSTEPTTKHAQDFIANPNVAGSIALVTKEVVKIEGVQLLGRIIKLEKKNLESATKMYFLAFPYARKMKINLWAMELNFIKMTYNKSGFARKLVWQK